MSSFMNDITEQRLTKIYEDLQKEQTKLMNDMKSGTTEVKEKDLTKQISYINSICLNVIKLINLRKKVMNSDT
jgi:arginine decarboxylase-like protein